jgi:hypothetical protein
MRHTPTWLRRADRIVTIRESGLYWDDDGIFEVPDEDVMDL